MAIMSNYLETSLGGYLNGDAFPTQLTDGVYFALFSSNPGEGETGGDELTETILGAGADRTLLEPGWGTVSSSGVTIQNISEIQITPGSQGDGTATHFAIFDSPSGGNKLIHGELFTPRVIATGDRVAIVAGSLDITFD